MPAAALLVHQLRYTLAYGSGASGALAAQGHAYLESFTPWIVVLLCVGLGKFAAQVSRALATGRGSERPRASFAALWALSSSGLVAVYATQELLEGLALDGHPGGIGGIFGHGGWWALAAAVAVGAAVAALMRVAAVVVEIAAAYGARRSRSAPSPAPRPILPVVLPRVVPLASAHAGRAPPAAAT
jgi:hypothetical protein